MAPLRWTHLLTLATILPNLLALPSITLKRSSKDHKLPDSVDSIMQIVMTEYQANPDHYQTWTFWNNGLYDSDLCSAPPSEQIIPGEGSDSPRFAQGYDINSPAWPAGVFNLELYGEVCAYKNNGTDSGALWCPSKQGQPIECDFWEGDVSAFQCGSDGYHAVVVCTWKR